MRIIYLIMYYPFYLDFYLVVYVFDSVNGDHGKIDLFTLSIIYYWLKNPDNSCFEAEKVRGLVVQHEYQYCIISCRIKMKKRCRTYPVETIWLKDDLVVLHKMFYFLIHIIVDVIVSPQGERDEVYKNGTQIQ